MTMQILTKCGRCGALVEPRQMPTARRGETVWLWSAAAICTVDTSGTVAMDFADTTVLCPDCLARFKAWLAGESEEPQEPQTSTDSAGKLVRDMARVFCCMHAGTQPFACWYFDHVKCDECPAYGCDHGCDQEMYNDIGRRASVFGINLVEGTEDEK